MILIDPLLWEWFQVMLVVIQVCLLVWVLSSCTWYTPNNAVMMNMNYNEPRNGTRTHTHPRTHFPPPSHNILHRPNNQEKDKWD
jgi:hypothetical protein